MVRVWSISTAALNRDLHAVTLRHSASHLLGWALESKFRDDCLLADGPATETGFFYDTLLIRDGHKFVERRLQDLDLGRVTTAELLDPARIRADIQRILQDDGSAIYFPSNYDLPSLVKLMQKHAAGKWPFVEMEVTREDAAKMFAFSPLKLHFIANIPATESVKLYRCGDFIDLCRGPHIANTKSIQAIKLTRMGASQWLPTMPQSLTRIYGVAFESKDLLREWEKQQEFAAKRDHRVVGKDQSLFYFSPLSPGAPFFLPHGTRIVQTLMEKLRIEYRRYGFDEVVTPLVFDKALWDRSGHWQNYKDDMFAVSGCCGHAHPPQDPQFAAGDIEPTQIPTNESEPEQALKPMNCPGHALMFSSTARSYRDLPIRYAEFSPLHRNEASGALTGLTRVRKFHQDDGHIFCAPDQIEGEIKDTLAFIDRMYSIFKFPSYELALSTRPESNYLGSLAEWDTAENSLRSALNSTGRSWTIKQGDGAFYGPKIDIAVKDALGRRHQTATIQLDFQLPARFDLKYQTPDGGFAQPVMVHRAILGSVERMLAILIEHYGGKWPFWLSPRQAIVVPVRAGLHSYAVDLQKQISGVTEQTLATKLSNRYFVDVDLSDHTLNKRIREAQQAQYNYILVVGDKEKETGTLSVRTRTGEQLVKKIQSCIMTVG
eukprot:jgi/Hompol1/4661/HPOL_003822-RA